MNHDTLAPSRVAVAVIALLAAGCAGNGGARPVAMTETLVPASGEWIRCVDAPRTGSRIPERNCLTESQWRRLEEASQDAGRAMQGPTLGTRESGGSPN